MRTIVAMMLALMVVGCEDGAGGVLYCLRKRQGFELLYIVTQSIIYTIGI